MTQEEFERIKNEEKNHLRKLKELKALLRDLERRKNEYTALETMSRTSREAFDVQSEMLRRLAMETAEAEARLDVALESAGMETSRLGEDDLLPREEPRVSEEGKIRGREAGGREIGERPARGSVRRDESREAAPRGERRELAQRGESREAGPPDEAQQNENREGGRQREAQRNESRRGEAENLTPEKTIGRMR